MPSAAIPFIATAASFLAKSVVAKFLIATVVSYGLNRLFTPKMDGLTDAYGDGTRSNIANNIQAIPIVYGTLEKIPGAVAFVKTTRFGVANNNDILNMVVCWGEGEFSAIDALQLDDHDSEDSAWTVGGVDYVVATNHHLGSDSQTVDLGLQSRVNTPNVIWDDNHRLRGVAYTYVCLRWNRDLFPGGIPLITANVTGRVCVDPRGGTSTDNPAVVLRDYLINPRFGCGIAEADLDDDSFIAAANYCDQNVYALLGQESPFPRYRCGGLLSPEDSRLTNIEAILSSMRGILIYTGGKYRLRLDKAEPTGFALDETNLVGDWQIELDAEGQRFNRVQVAFVNKANHSQPDLRIVDSPTYLAADQNVVLQSQLDLPMTTDEIRAKMLAGIELRASRFAMRVSVTAIASALNCEVGDVVSLTHSVTGWNLKPFRVEQMTLLDTDEVRLVLREYSSSVYDITSENEWEYPPGFAMPDPRYMAPISLILIQSREQTSTTHATATLAWQAGDGSNFLAGFTIEWRRQGSSDQWQSSRLAGSDVNGWVDWAGAADQYFVWRTPALRIGSLWTFRVKAYNTMGVHSAALQYNLEITA